MPITPYYSGEYYTHGLTYKIAQLERMAVTHAYSMHHYGSFMGPYTISGEYPGDLSIKLLNRAYMLFAASARYHFISTVYFYFPSSPFSTATTSITLPLGHLRVLRSVGIAEARQVDLAYTITIPSEDLGGGVYLINAVQNIGANVAAGSLNTGDTIVQMFNRTSMAQPPPAPVTTYAWVGGQGAMDPISNPFAYFPSWRVTPNVWRGTALRVGTQATTVLGTAPLAFSDPITDFMARAIPTPVFGDGQTRSGLVVIDGDHGNVETAQPVHPYTVDYTPYVIGTFSGTLYSNFFAFSEPLVPFGGDVSVLSGGRLTLKKPTTELPGSFVIAVRGEVEFRPAITLDRCEPYQEDYDQPIPGLRVPPYPAVDPSTSRLAPMMLSPVPNYEHAGFLEKYHVAVAQAMFVSHLSPDDSRYAGEQEVLNNFIAAMAKEPDKEFRQRYAYPTDLASGNNVIRTG